MTDTHHDGVFVTLDGPGGVGKSTVTAALAEQLTTLDRPVLATREPTDTTLGNLARHGTDTYSGLPMAHLIAADRHLHLATEIRPALARGAVVICDRYIASSLVLQRIDGLTIDTVWEINRHADRPDLSVILTAHPEALDGRLAARGAHSRYERMPGSSKAEAEFYVDAANHLTAAGIRTLVLDATHATPTELARTIAATVTALRTGGTP
ncbi:dTMP kinase [Streptomyces gilvosporeus]|uniref:Thymidylate kinase n=1 Tax=Streptomyces gilvosporeus TaxID=553510 RepID=A0A1V0TSS4_9ACTN|nr:dTMP kinase [Streptomyces gilvosporeus]ARF56014.1 dTMP kinase [Streptomyces gilvosporeus]